MSVTVKADVFPAVVTITTPGGESRIIDKARIVVTEGHPDRVLIFHDAPNGPELVYSNSAVSYLAPKTAQRLREMHRPEFSTYQITTPDDTLSATKSSGCGCGSRLKSFNPFPTITALNAP